VVARDGHNLLEETEARREVVSLFDEPCHRRRRIENHEHSAVRRVLAKPVQTARLARRPVKDDSAGNGAKDEDANGQH
jgi:hypothetical protein